MQDTDGTVLNFLTERAGELGVADLEGPLDGMNSNIVVSVICLTYNHEKYIRQCLEGFVGQKTNFQFEVIIHDDASTDKTPEIIREYCEKYPNIIRAVYQRINQYSQGVDIHKQWILPLIKGKYIALCEGDDFWTDEHKLQKQCDIMEQMPTCKFCVHKAKRVRENGGSMMRYYPSIKVKRGLMCSWDFFAYWSKGYPFHTSCYFLRADDWATYLQLKMTLDFAKELAKLGIGDETILLYWGQLGDIYYFDEAMSCRRENVPGGWCYRNSQKTDAEKRKYRSTLSKAWSLFDLYSGKKYHSFIEHRKKYGELGLFFLNRSEQEYKELFADICKGHYSDLNFRQKFLVFLGAYFPLLFKVLKKLRGFLFG